MKFISIFVDREVQPLVNLNLIVNQNRVAPYSSHSVNTKIMGKYFTIEELSHSQTATSRGIDNTPKDEIKENLEVMIDRLLDPVREQWGSPITVNSGYRGLELNKAVGGVATSQHTKGQAVDITAGSPEKNKALFEMIQASDMEYDQLIDERNFTWLHLSYKVTGCRKQVLHL